MCKNAIYRQLFNKNYSNVVCYYFIIHIFTCSKFLIRLNIYENSSKLYKERLLHNRSFYFITLVPISKFDKITTFQNTAD